MKLALAWAHFEVIFCILKPFGSSKTRRRWNGATSSGPLYLILTLGSKTVFLHPWKVCNSNLPKWVRLIWSPIISPFWKWGKFPLDLVQRSLGEVPMGRCPLKSKQTNKNADIVGTGTYLVSMILRKDFSSTSLFQPSSLSVHVRVPFLTGIAVFLQFCFIGWKGFKNLNT